MIKYLSNAEKRQRPLIVTDSLHLSPCYFLYESLLGADPLSLLVLCALPLELIYCPTSDVASAIGLINFLRIIGKSPLQCHFGGFLERE